MQKGDFTASVRLLWIAALGIGIGAVAAYVAVALLWLIGIFTQLFYYPGDFFTTLFQQPGQLLAIRELSPAGNQLGIIAVLVPVLGGLIIGFMARYGSDRIRGHGIPEAIEAILIGRSRMSPKVAVLKPLSSAISIGSGGPFGAEGPIIMTGGAFGSIAAQAFHLTAAERKTLLVAGAAGGMSATFAAPVAAVLLAVELLLFEWKPRSLIPVAMAAATAALLRRSLLNPGPLFPVVPHPQLDGAAWLAAAGIGLLAGLLALFLTGAVYAMEDLFHRLPIHWMWWPALGGLAVGIGGLIAPHALGIGINIIRGLLQGNIVRELGTDPQHLTSALLVLIAVKCTIWSVALGSGTSGGVLAPLLMMGGTLGALLSPLLPGNDPALWSLVSMAAVLGGTMRSPLTGAVFALELTNDINALPALLVGSVVAYGFTVLVMKRSILTEKIARRGYHVSREYTVDPLELLTVEEVMTREVVVVPGSLPVPALLKQYFLGDGQRPHQAFPVVDSNGRLLGMVTRTNVLEDWIAAALTEGQGPPRAGLEPIITYDLIHRDPITIYPWESCRTAAERMAEYGVGRLPVVSPDDPGKLVGLVTRSDLLKARAKTVEEEMRRERLLGA
ncbi:MAG TPA: chloride channel protein [Gemmataceae bacterium]|nr:chloride channel protein [Gemmataceae bacterium]